MYKEKTNRRLIGLGVVLFAAGMAAAYLWDLPIDTALHSPQNFAAIFMETLGFYPLYLPVVLWLALIGNDEKRPVALRALCMLGAVAGCGGLLAYSLHGMEKRGVAQPLLAAGTVWCALFFLYFCLVALMARRPEAFAARVRFAARWGCVYMLLDNVAVNALKLLWNRTRFDDMLALGDFSAFTHWLRPLGNGGSSFPSGHTAAACSIFVLVLLCDVFPGWHKRRALVWGACWAYVGGMVLSRLVMGRHYLSDTLAAAFLMTALFLWMTKWKAYRRDVQRLALAGHDLLEETPGENGA